jgi:YYY domain-containing protein
MGLDLPDIFIWWLALEIIGLAALPISAYLGSNLKDFGYSISKTLGLLLLTYISWILSNFGSTYNTFLLIFSLVIIAMGSLIICFKKGIPAFERNYVLKFEFLFLIAFIIFAIIRAFSPEIHSTGGEKFMDMSFINSLLQTTQLPPSDTWMSGTAVHYYYFGYLIVANLIKITGILPSIAFNLATASFFALSLTTAFGIGYNLTERVRYGFVTAFFVAIAGNLVGFFQLMDILMKNDVLNNILSYNYWTSSRVIPDTINEFPFFSFLQGDVHAHMISITFALLIILLLLNIMKSGPESKTSFVALIFILGLSIGFLYPLNTWDYPVYLVMAMAVIAFRFFHLPERKNRNTFLSFIAMGGSIAVLSYLLYLPYHMSYKLERTISIVDSGRTSLIYYLAIYGLFLFFIFRFVILNSRKSGLKSIYYIVTLIIFSLLSVVLKFQLLFLLALLLLLSILSIINEKENNKVFVLILITTGTLLSLFCELFYVQDALGSGNHALIRMNTVFKLYVSNWMLWGVSAGYIMYQYRDSFTKKTSWSIVAMILILMVIIYPVFATIGRSEGFNHDPTLDGEAYIKKEHPQEYPAILWFRNITGQPVVLQAPGSSYSWSSYITTFTGLPTVLGWAGHEITWRTYSFEINKRLEDTNTIYISSDLDKVDSLLKKYNVSYIYYGESEMKKYGSTRHFESHQNKFLKVFEYEDTVVYKV